MTIDFAVRQEFRESAGVGVIAVLLSVAEAACAKCLTLTEPLFVW